MNTRTAPSFDPDGLYEIVATYVGFGNHHTGTRADAETTAWLVDLLGRMGASVAEDRYEFDRFVCAAELVAGGQVVPSVPVFYSAAGEWRTRDISVVDVDRTVAGNPRGIDPHLGSAANAEALVLALDGPDDLTVQCNRVPAMPASGGRPAVIVPGNWAQRVRGADAELVFAAHVETGASANVIASLGAPDAPAINITTPLTGWTPAGGERGTGLAVALAMAADLSTDHRVTLSVCSGHEIDHIGLKHYLAHLDAVGETVVHLGASVAATEPDSTGPARLGDQRMVLTTATGELRTEIGRRVPAANWQLRSADPWPGEGGTWFEAGASVLSFLGGASLFHTTADTETATSPEAMALAAE
ncbi:MAG: hypothetical protein AAGA65_15410, partial [Actinomycetota bacterium]